MYAKPGDGGCVEAGDVPDTVMCDRAGDVVDFSSIVVFTPAHDEKGGVTAEWLLEILPSECPELFEAVE